MRSLDDQTCVNHNTAGRTIRTTRIQRTMSSNDDIDHGPDVHDDQNIPRMDTIVAYTHNTTVHGYVRDSSP